MFPDWWKTGEHGAEGVVRRWAASPCMSVGGDLISEPYTHFMLRVDVGFFILRRAMTAEDELMTLRTQSAQNSQRGKK